MARRANVVNWSQICIFEVLETTVGRAKPFSLSVVNWSQICIFEVLETTS